MRDALTSASYGPEPAEWFDALEDGLIAVALTQTEELTFRALDSDATTSEWPYAAHVVMGVRDNLAVALRDRWYGAGVSLGGTQTTGAWSGPGLSSPWPVPWGVQWVYAPEQQIAAVRCRLVRGAVDFEDQSPASSGRTAVRLCLTSVSPDGRFTLPPSSPDHPDWVPLYVTADTDVIVEVPLSGRQLCAPGWVGAALWTWSEVKWSSNRGSGEVTGGDGAYTVELDSANYATGVQHLALLLTDSWNTGKAYDSWGGSDDGGLYGVGYLYSPLGALGPVEVSCLPPPRKNPLAFAAGVQRWELHALGYVEAQAFYLEVLPGGPRVPARDAYASNTRCKGPVDQRLVSAASRIVRNRVPSWGGYPVIDRGSSPGLGVWYGDDMEGARITVDTAKSVAATNVPYAIPDHQGYTGICSLQRIGVQTEAPPADMQIRLAAYTPGSYTLPQTASPWTDMEWLDWSHDSAEFSGVDSWSGVAVQGAMQRRSVDHQWRWMGSLMGHPGGPADWAVELSRTRHFVVNWLLPGGVGGLVYPVELRIELRLKNRDLRTAVFCCGARIASLPRNVPL